MNVGDAPVKLKLAVYDETQLRELEFLPSQTVQSNVDTIVC